MAYDPTLSREIDWLRFHMADTDDSAPVISETEYAALLSGVGFNRAGYMAARRILADRGLILKWTDGDVSEDHGDVAKRLETLASDFLKGRFDRSGPGRKVVAIAPLVNPDLTGYRTD